MRKLFILLVLCCLSLSSVSFAMKNKDRELQQKKERFLTEFTGKLEDKLNGVLEKIELEKLCEEFSNLSINGEGAPLDILENDANKAVAQNRKVQDFNIEIPEFTGVVEK